MSQFSEQKKQRILINCLVVCVILLILNIALSIRFTGTSFIIGDMELQINTLNGCVQTVTFIFCVLMVFASPKKGLIFSCIVISVSFFGALRTIIMAHTLTPIPSAFNCLLFVVAVLVIFIQYRKSETKAITDDTTGIRNSYAFEYDLYKTVLHNERGFLIFAHLDGFLPINSNLGRDKGDEVLKVVANRIKAFLNEKSSVYKVEGAEYAIILLGEESCENFAEQIVRIIEEPITLKKGDVVTNCYLTPYLGIASFLEGDISAENLIKHADIAMNHAVKSNDEKIFVFNDSMKENIEKEARVENLIKEGLKNNYFRLVYQPQFTTADKRLRGFETLIRMTTPSGENVPPSIFISIAEKSELILDIDRYVIREAMEEFREICNATDNTLTLAINVSAKEISRAGFADKILKVIDEVGFPAECLEIEITEYSFAGAGSHTIENICKLRENQIMIALDDFGTGYTSLEQLMRLPVNLVKLDKSLVDNIAKKKMNTDFIKSIIYLGHLMDAEVIAEGVEYEDQLKLLREMDCDFTQGYLWGRPMEYLDAKDLARESLG